MSQRARTIKNLRTIKAMRGQSLTIDLGEVIEGDLSSWMKTDPNDTTHRSLEVSGGRYLFLTKDKAQDYYDSNTGKLIQAIEGRWYFDVVRTPVGGTSIDEEVVYTGTIDFENNITNSNGQELVGSIIDYGFDKHYVHSQGLPESVWYINSHGLEKYPSVTVVDSAESVVVGQVEYIDLDNIRITFNAGFSGEAYLN